MDNIQFAPFNCNGETSALGPKWKKWKRSFAILLGSKGITDKDRKMNILLHCAGPEVQDVYFALPISERVFQDGEDPYKLTMDGLDAYFSPKAVKGKNCSYNDLDDQIRDQVIEKCISSDLRRKILEKGDLQLVREIAKAHEATEMQLSIMESSGSTAVYKVSYKEESDGTKKRSEARTTKSCQCFRCGANSCKHVDSVCHYCKETGHLGKLVSKEIQNQIVMLSLIKILHQVREAQDCCTEQVVDIYDVDAAEKSAMRAKFFCRIAVEGVRIKFELDSGAAVTIMGKKDFDTYLPRLTIHPTDISLISYTQTPLDLVGYSNVNVTYKNKLHRLRLYTTKSNNTPLFGREWIRQLRLDFDEIFQINSLNPTKTYENLELNKIIQEYKPLFQNIVGKIKNIQARLRLKENSTPVFTKSRSVPFDLHEKVKDELDSLIDQAILEPVPVNGQAQLYQL
nr:unnamed protein product [Callosobruchus analis]